MPGARPSTSTYPAAIRCLPASARADEPKHRELLEATPVIDLDGADMLTKVHRQLADGGVRLLLTHADTDEFDVLERAGTIDAIGQANVFETVRAAVAAATGA